MLVFLAAGMVPAQTSKGWHLKDNEKSGYEGISLDKAYAFLKEKKKKSTPIIVAVIDSGIDTTHEDLKQILWRNKKEIAGNGKDDDNNGYVDDINGWNFLGGKDGKSVKEDSYEAARVYHNLKSKYEGKTIDVDKLSKEDQLEYNMWKNAKTSVIGGDENQVDLTLLKKVLNNLKEANDTLKIAMNKEVFTGNELDDFLPAATGAKKAKSNLLDLMKRNDMLDKTNKDFIDGFDEFISGEIKKDEAKSKAPEDYRTEITGDDESDWKTRGYGNNDLMGGTPMHGTHVSGIIAASRNNGKGMDGIADNVQIMMIRAVPDGDEHDKDIALAIRYAVDNGAKIINMSFGKGFSPYKKWIDEAVAYAQTKGVLLVHAAGNDAKDVDHEDNFPCPKFFNSEKRATNWITVGASGDPKLGGLFANFSNYGKTEVDVFAPGVKIYSTLPGKTTYGSLDGTSMASPVVAGVAALVKSYFPNLTPEQIKKAIESSSVKPDFKAAKPGDGEMVNLSDISKTGGLVNAYGALKAAYEMSNTQPTPKPKTKITKPVKG
jgi:subtilisin family serine protease